MIKKKNKFLTFVFSMLPGAGHMYMGFMKIGLSFMSVFFFLIFLASWLDIGPLLFLLPLVWFYSVFDCTNRGGLSSEELILLEDKYLFSLDKLIRLDKDIFEKRRLAAGGLLLILGVYLVADNMINFLARYIPYDHYKIIREFMGKAPQVIIGIVICAVGIRLILGKKKECEMDA